MAKKRAKPKSSRARSAKPKGEASKKRKTPDSGYPDGWQPVSAAQYKAMIKSDKWLAGIDLGLRRAAKTARKVARMHGTPIYFWKNGKVVAEKP
jgi:hypothetical protein